MMSEMAFLCQYVAFSLIAYLQSQQAERRILSSLPCLWILTSWPSQGSLKRETAWDTHCIWHSQEVKERTKQKSIQNWILWYPPPPTPLKIKWRGGGINPCLNARSCQLIKDSEWQVTVSLIFSLQVIIFWHCWTRKCIHNKEICHHFSLNAWTGSM